MQLRPPSSGPLSSLIMTADFVQSKEGLPLRRFNKHWGLWYYEHAVRIGGRLLRSKVPQEEYCEELGTRSLLPA